MKQPILIVIVDFAHNEGYLAEQLLRFVSDRYDFVLTEDNPDFILHSCFGRDVLTFDGVRIFFSGGNSSSDFNTGAKESARPELQKNVPKEMGFEPKVPKTTAGLENRAAVCFSSPHYRSMELDFGFEFLRIPAGKII